MAPSPMADAPVWSRCSVHRPRRTIQADWSRARTAARSIRHPEPGSDHGQGRSGQHEAVLVERYLTAQPSGAGLCPDEDQQGTGGDLADLASLVVLDDQVLEGLLPQQFSHLGMALHFDLAAPDDLID